jgi:hypothetical protein
MPQQSIFDVITWIIFGEEYKLWGFSTVQSAQFLCYFLCYFLSIRLKYCHHPTLIGPQPMHISQWERPSFTPIQDSVPISLAAQSKAWIFRPLACWERGIESRRRHGYLSLVSIACCEVVVYETGWSLFQRSPTEICVCRWVRSGATITFCTYNM